MSVPPRNVIYFNSKANPIPLAGIGNLPYTDVIVGFLVQVIIRIWSEREVLSTGTF